MKFRYPRVQFLIRFLALSAILAALLFLLMQPGASMLWLLCFCAVFIAAIAAVAVTPMFTCHEISPDGIVLRQGILFSAMFPFSEILDVQRHQAPLWSFGFVPRGVKGRIVLANANRNLVSIKLKERRRFGMLLMRSADEIIIDLEKPDEFVRMASDKSN